MRDQDKTKKQRIAELKESKSERGSRERTARLCENEKRVSQTQGGLRLR